MIFCLFVYSWLRNYRLEIWHTCGTCCYAPLRKILYWAGVWSFSRQRIILSGCWRAEASSSHHASSKTTTFDGNRRRWIRSVTSLGGVVNRPSLPSQGGAAFFYTLLRRDNKEVSAVIVLHTRGYHAFCPGDSGPRPSGKTVRRRQRSPQQKFEVCLESRGV